MPHFTDADGRDWLVLFSIVEARIIKDVLDVDLLNVGDETLYRRLTDEECLIVDVLHICCREQCDDRQVDPVGFARALRGDALDDACRAFLEAYVSFFRSHRRAVLKAALAKTELIFQRSAEQAVKAINSQQTDRLLEAKLQELGEFFDRNLQTAAAAAAAAAAADSGGSSPSGPLSPASDRPTGSPSAS